MARDFPGSDGNVLTGGGTGSVDITGQYMTACCWFQIDDSTGNHVFLSKYRSEGTNTRQYILGFTGGGNKVFWHIAQTGAGGVNLTSIDDVTTGRWYHACGVKAGNVMYLYLNGEYQGETASTQSMTSATDATFMIGRQADGDSQPLNGRVSRAAIWDVALNEHEVRKLFLGYSPRMIRDVSLRGYWPLNDYAASGGARDLSKWNNTLVMSGAVPLVADPTLSGASFVTYLPVEVEVGAEEPDVPEETIDSTTVRLSITITAIEEKVYTDAATVYLDITVSGVDEYAPPCLIIGEGEAQLRWTAGDDYLRWIGYDANTRWGAEYRIGTAHC